MRIYIYMLYILHNNKNKHNNKTKKLWTLLSRPEGRYAPWQTTLYYYAVQYVHTYICA